MPRPQAPNFGNAKIHLGSLWHGEDGIIASCSLEKDAAMIGTQILSVIYHYDGPSTLDGLLIVEVAMECPFCGSDAVVERRVGRRVGGALGSAAGAVAGGSAALSGGEAGAALGTVLAGPIGTLGGGLSGMILGGLLGAVLGGRAGEDAGAILDERVLDPYGCTDCGRTFRLPLCK